jgi:hypothetical protein
MNISYIRKRLTVNISGKQIKETYANELKVLCEHMDKRDKFYRLLEEHYQKTGEIPHEYISGWAGYLTEGRYLMNYTDEFASWKKLKKVYKRIKNCAILNTINILNGGRNEKAWH